MKHTTEYKDLTPLCFLKTEEHTQMDQVGNMQKSILYNMQKKLGLGTLEKGGGSTYGDCV